MKNKVVFPILSFLILSVGTSCQVNNEIDSLFQKTISDICEYSNLKGEYTDQRSKQISDNAYRLIHSTPDSVLRIEKKLDLLHALIFYQNYAYKSYRAIVRNEFLSSQKTYSSREMMFIFPISICDNCNYEIINKIKNQGLTLTDNSIIPKKYKEYYNKLGEYISKSNSDDSDFTSGIYIKTLIQYEIINKEWFSTTYPCFNQ